MHEQENDLFPPSSKWSHSAALFGIAISLIVLSGWALHIPLLQGVILNYPAMVPMTALSIFLLSSALLLSAWAPFLSTLFSPRRLDRVSQGLAILAALISAVTLLEHLFQIDTGLSHLFLNHEVKENTNLLFSGKMSVQSSLIVALLSSSLLLYRRNDRSWIHFVSFQSLPLASLVLCLTAIVGYMNRIGIHGPSKLLGLSLPTAIAYSFLSFGILTLTPQRGFVSKLFDRGSEGIFTRWYVAFSLIAPVLINSVIVWGEGHHFYPAGFSATLFVIIMVIGLIAMGHFLGKALHAAEEQRLSLAQNRSQAMLSASEENLKITKERLELALDASKMGIWENNLVDMTAYWSPTLKKMLGVDESISSTHLNFLNYVHPEDRERLQEVREHAIRHREDLNYDFRVNVKNGVRWLRSKGRVKYDSYGRAVMINGTTLDITSEKLHQEFMEKALQEAESASQLKSTFLANMSHEIRTPLGAILGFTELLQDIDLPADKRRQFLEVIARNGQTLSQLLNDILDLSKVEAGYLHMENLPCSLQECITEVMDSMRIRATEKGIYLKAEVLPGTPLSIVTDPLRLKHIVMNLIGNAIKFTSQGGVSLRVYAEAPRIFFEITDTGIGIDEQQKEKLFQAFSQADGSMSRKYGGTGLGLLLSKKLAQQMGGDVELAVSVPGEGSCFVASLLDQTQIEAKQPQQALEQAPRTGNSLSEESALMNLNILVAEDTPDNQTLISSLLQKNGARPILTANGEECVQRALSEDFDAILMDIQMPVLDGYQATAFLREQGYSKPIIALTAHAMNDVTEKCLEVGCNAHLTKPIQQEELVRTIQSLVL